MAATALRALNVVLRQDESDEDLELISSGRFAVQAIRDKQSLLERAAWLDGTFKPGKTMMLAVWMCSVTRSDAIVGCSPLPLAPFDVYWPAASKCFNVGVAKASLCTGQIGSFAVSLRPTSLPLQGWCFAGDIRSAREARANCNVSFAGSLDAEKNVFAQAWENGEGDELQSPSDAEAVAKVGDKAAAAECIAQGLDFDQTTSKIEVFKLEHHSYARLEMRFGHTTTFVGDNRVVLFGGATGDSGRYTITADAFMLNVHTNTWSRVQAGGTLPFARAAHAAACVDHSQMVIYGGATGGGSLSSDELYLLDIRNEESSQWMSVPVMGTTPGRRYGHTMIFNKPLLIVFGGNNGQQAECDIWILDVERSPFQWQEVAVMGKRGPLPRVYHSAEVCREGPAAGMMVVFGGRTAENKSLKDTWGLRQHRDGRWDWVEAPAKRGAPPEPRFQHSCIFLDSKLLIVGGRGPEVNKILPTAVYDTETCEWHNLCSLQRFRHSSWGMGTLLFSYGGFDHKNPSAPTSDLQVMDIEVAITASQSGVVPKGEEAETAETGLEAAPAGTLDLVPPTYPGTSKPRDPTRPGTADGTRPATPPRSRALATAPASRGVDLNPGDVKVSPQVYVSHEKDFTHLVEKVNIESLAEEGRKIHSSNVMANIARNAGDEGIHTHCINALLQPTTWQPDANPNSFLLSAAEVSRLCDQTLEVLKSQEMVLRLRAPIKVYGDIHGQFLDLMRLFARYKAPWDGENGDIESMDYLFLGDYVDRGAFSLETVCLLFSLKVKYPNQIHMIRGNHEDPTINAIYGFRDECRRRLNEEPEDPESCWNKFNRAFEWLPVGAVIEDRILCLHGGIGGSVNNVAEVRTMQRPLHVAQIPQTPFEQRITDLLWSDPSDNDSVPGVSLNETRDPDGTGRIVKFGPDRVEEFLEKNKPLSMIIRAHECVMDGFERFANGKLITVFSATDYCGHHKNAGALLFVRRDLTVVPKLIYPVERQQMMWDPAVMQQRPPTPPRPVPRARKLGEDEPGIDW
ncbi:BSL1 [Symbiodinium sp. KB8]|nr:BSL1 [Symbiodinium sp. KB8]